MTISIDTASVRSEAATIRALADECAQLQTNTSLFLNVGSTAEAEIALLAQVKALQDSYYALFLNTAQMLESICDSFEGVDTQVSDAMESDGTGASARF